jgi:hypothetical protein
MPTNANFTREEEGGDSQLEVHAGLPEAVAEAHHPHQKLRLRAQMAFDEAGPEPRLSTNRRGFSRCWRFDGK